MHLVEFIFVVFHMMKVIDRESQLIWKFRICCFQSM